MAYLVEPVVHVGIVEDGGFGLCLEGKYSINFFGDDTIIYIPDEDNSVAIVSGVEIGKDFHWRRKEVQKFHGDMILKRTDDGRSVLINRISVEKYLQSVISSEMNPSAPVEFLKAHAVISRSWLLRQLDRKRAVSNKKDGCSNGNKRHIYWTDMESHSDFDICADDHCQRYQGAGKVNEAAKEAVESTRGLILQDDKGETVDARFSKCCGGRTEIFSSCWQDMDFDYLQSIEDKFCNPSLLSDEEKKTIIPTVLSNYDFETTDYFEWERGVKRNLVRGNIKKLLHVDIGDVVDMMPVKRGKSGRITELRIIGKDDEVVVGKELMIRRLLSDTHLYSSAFEIEYDRTGDFILKGKGWGHGVGLCQIGAAVMACKGFGYEEILSYYYPNTKITKVYG